MSKSRNMYNQRTFNELKKMQENKTQINIPSISDDVENDVLNTQDNVVLKNGVYTITCPFDGEEFKSTSLGKVLHEEGVYRSRNFVTDKHIPHESDLEKNETLVEDWSRSKGETSTSSQHTGMEKVDSLPKNKDFRTVYLVDTRDTGKCEKFKQEKKRKGTT